MSQPLNVGIYIFENMTMLDGYAPFIRGAIQHLYLCKRR